MLIKFYLVVQYEEQAGTAEIPAWCVMLQKVSCRWRHADCGLGIWLAAANKEILKGKQEKEKSINNQMNSKVSLLQKRLKTCTTFAL